MRKSKLREDNSLFSRDARRMNKGLTDCVQLKVKLLLCCTADTEPSSQSRIIRFLPVISKYIWFEPSGVLLNTLGVASGTWTFTISLPQVVLLYSWIWDCCVHHIMSIWVCLTYNCRDEESHIINREHTIYRTFKITHLVFA